MGGTLLHPMCPTIREERDDLVPLSYTQKWEIKRVRVVAVPDTRKSETSAGVVTASVRVTLEVSPHASSGTASDSIVRKALTNAVGATDVVRSIEKLSMKVDALKSIAVNTASAGRHDGASYATRTTSFRADIIPQHDGTNATGVMFEVTAYADVLRRIATLEEKIRYGRELLRTIETSAHAVALAQSFRSNAAEGHAQDMKQSLDDDDALVRASKWRTADLAHAKAVAAAQAHHESSVVANDEYETAHGEQQGREHRITQELAAERLLISNPRKWEETSDDAYFMSATTSLGMELKATYASGHSAAAAATAFLDSLESAGVTAAAVASATIASVNRTAYVDIVLEPASLSQERSMYVLMGAINHFARILEEGTASSTLDYVDVGSYGDRCSIALSPPAAAATTSVQLLFATSSTRTRHAAPVFGFEKSKDIKILRGAAKLSPYSCLFHRAGQFISVRCPEMESRSSGGRSMYWFDYGYDAYSLSAPLLRTGTVSLRESTTPHAVADFSPPIGALDALTITLHTPDDIRIPSSDMPRRMHLVIEVSTPSS
jgi:hypothetical protein